MHWEIDNSARGQVVSQPTPFVKSGLATLEAGVVCSEHICSGKMFLLHEPLYGSRSKPCNSKPRGLF